MHVRCGAASCLRPRLWVQPLAAHGSGVALGLSVACGKRGGTGASLYTCGGWPLPPRHGVRWPRQANGRRSRSPAAPSAATLIRSQQLAARQPPSYAGDSTTFVLASASGSTGAEVRPASGVSTGSEAGVGGVPTSALSRVEAGGAPI